MEHSSHSIANHQERYFKQVHTIHEHGYHKEVSRDHSMHDKHAGHHTQDF